MVTNYPVDGQITSGFGFRARPTAGASSNHKGIDFGAPIGTPVRAPFGGKVTFAGVQSGYGNVVYVQDNNGLEQRFAHLSDFNVNMGDSIAAGQNIGTVGMTGTATGPHLHYETRKDGKAIDPKSLLEKGKDLVELAKSGEFKAAARVGAAIATGGASEAALVVGDTLGITGDCNIICQIKKWFSEGKFFERLGLAILGLIVIWAAFMLFSSGTVQRQISQVVKG